MNNQDFDTLKNLDVTVTSYAVCNVKANLRTPKRLGQGKCKAVRLLLPRYLADLATDQPVLVVRYGDNLQQVRELMRNVNNNPSDLIICNDLSDVYILAATEVDISVIIYN